MATDINKTNEILYGFCMDNDKINAGYLNDELALWLDNTRYLSDEVPNKRRTPEAMACMVITDYVNVFLNNSNPGRNLTCTLYQIEKFLNDHADGWDTLMPLVNYIEEQREVSAA